MKCTRVGKFLPLHIAGDLTGRRARAVAKHLTTCAACRHAAAEYDTSRKLLRAEADSLPPEFDGAFYEEIRSSVLAQIKQGRTLAPPPSNTFLSFFNGRLAYAVSFALIVIAAALSLHSYMHRTAGDATTKAVFANANHNLPVTPLETATPKPNQATIRDQQSLHARGNIDGVATSGRNRGAESPLAKRRTRNENPRSGAQPGFMLTGNKPSNAGRNTLAPNTNATRQAANPQELATGGNSTRAALAEVSRIEIQTSDPNIRIIWLTPATDSEQPLK